MSITIIERKMAVEVVAAILYCNTFNGKRPSIEEAREMAEEIFAEYNTELMGLDTASKVGGKAIFDLLPELSDLTSLEDRYKQVASSIVEFNSLGRYPLSSEDEDIPETIPFNEYERPERECFSSEVPCLCLTGMPKEDEEYLEDEQFDDYLMRCFAKEYPDMSLEEFERRFYLITEDISSLESMYSTMDFEGSGTMLGFTLPDYGYLTIEEMANLFNELVERLEE